ncbi:MAG: PIG-L family deacetylase [Chloroflexi bacterium]|nr:PIG-L family deacetylase [Chloroflexota bacterium]
MGAPLTSSGHLMVIGAHAGDAENMAGATVLKHTRGGHRATIVHLTLGEAGHPTLPPAVYAGQRKREIQASAGLMGADVVTLDYRDGELPVSEAIKLQVCDLIRQAQPTIILTHWRGSFHKDHVATHEIVRDAIFYAALPAVQRAAQPHRVQGLYFPENWEDMDGWRADIYLDVSAVWDEYLAVLRSHEFIRGGISTFRYLDYYDALGTTRGCLGGFRKAAALMLPPGAWVRRLDYLA